ncbi:beta-N-acetylhexosaminidase [Gallaecimonas sp. GXIMD1310]|uniref:beta-N-acetylhexosaminidase n=1 Tax=Gallaecimonas sp. GXIMD1310 TaxID=3131926 RepID=UPI00324384F5
MAQLLIDLVGTQLTPQERQLLAHPACAGVILFSRNYQHPEQLKALVEQCRQAAARPIIISVDQEGGRVQRFRQGFTRLPAPGWLLTLGGGNLAVAKYLAWSCGLVMATELRSLGVDLSFAPVLDLGVNQSVIGDRAFARDSTTVTTLARAMIAGMAVGGMAACAKHYPGHGQVQGDTHLEEASDQRSLDTISATDEQPFRQLIGEQRLAALMPAHVMYPAVDPLPASSSTWWLTRRLRGELAFKGLIFSDDLSMKGAHRLGTPAERAQGAAKAGCDLLLCCNDPGSLPAILAVLAGQPPVALAPLQGQAPSASPAQLARAQSLLVSMTSPCG